MVSSMKRYRSLVNLLIKALDREFRSTSGLSIAYDKTRITRGIRSNFQNQLYGATFSLFITYDCLKLKAVEEKDGKIYVGVDLTQKPSVRLDDDRNGTDAYIWDIMYWFIKASEPNSKLEADLGYDKYQVLNNQNLFYQSEAYKKIRIMLDSAVEDYTVTSFLSEGDWPRLSDRSILPVAVLDFDKNQITYITQRMTTSYRKNNDTIPIDIFASRTINEVSSIQVPAPLVNGQYRNKFAGTHNI